MEQVLLSVICTTYNHERFIEDALKSFLSQKTSFPFEVIVIDDASTDKTADIVRSYERKFPTIIKGIYLEENYHSAKKSKLPLLEKASSGKYVAICEGDDYWIDEKKLEKQVTYLENHPKCSWCIHNAEAVDANKKFLKKIETVKESRYVDTDEVILGGGGFCATNSIVTLSELYFHRPSYFEIYSIDAILQIYLASRGDTYCFEEYMSAYRQQVSGSWTVRTIEDPQFNKYGLKKSIEARKAFNVATDYKYDSAIKKIILKNEFYIDRIDKNRSCLVDKKYKSIRDEMNLREKISLFVDIYIPFIKKLIFKIKPH